LPRANGMMQTMWSLSGIVAPGIAAFVIALPALARQGLIPGALGTWLADMANGTALVILIDAATFFFSSAVLVVLYVPSPRRALAPVAGRTRAPGWGADFREGVTFIRRRPALLWLLATFTVANFTASPIGVFQPLIVKFDLAADWAARGMTLEAALALLASVGAIGGLVGGLAVSGWGGLKHRRVWGVLVPMVIAGVAQVLFGLSSLLYFTAAMAFVEQAMVPVMNAHSQSIWQTQTPPELQGRVFSVRRVIAQFTWPLSVFLAGFLGARFDPGLAVAALGLVGTVFAVAQLFNPALRRVEDPAPPPEAPAGRPAAADGAA
jgi:MFS transporter, DHA3 family, macrolide efflux protein